MLSHQQILHFAAFGYVTLRGLLSQSEVTTLRQEVTDALTDAFGRLATEPNDLGGISGDYLPLAADRAPFSQSLIADVVAFHMHLMNCAQGGLPRLSWTIDYRPWPGIADRERMGVVRDFVNDDVEFDHEDYDRDRWPAWREWAAGADQTLSRAIAVERLTLLGVL